MAPHSPSRLTIILSASLLCLCIAIPSAAFADDAAADQHRLIGVAASSQSSSTADQARTAWFRQAGLGLFIHWGLASIPGNLDLSWGMIKNTPWDAGAKNKNKLAPNAYFALASQFKPTNYHPERWLQAAKDAGFGYAVLTTRHHDGFALWPSRTLW